MPNYYEFIKLAARHPTWARVWLYQWLSLQRTKFFGYGQRRLGEYKLYICPIEEAITKATAQPAELAQLVIKSWPIEFEAFSKPSSIPKTWNASPQFAKLCYTICRLVKPLKVVETGIGNGVTSWSILQALHENGSGELYSIELPPLTPRSESYVGHLVPESLRAPWRIILGPSQRVLRQMLPKIGHVDIFVHDSHHTYQNQKGEYKIVWRWLRTGGILISDDVATDALLEVEQGIKPILIQQDKPSFIGILVKGNII